MKRTHYILTALFIVMHYSPLLSQLPGYFLGDNWEMLNPLPTSSNLRAITDINGKVYIGGDNGFLASVQNTKPNFKQIPSTISGSIIGIMPLQQSSDMKFVIDNNGNIRKDNDAAKSIGQAGVIYTKATTDKNKGNIWVVGEKGNYIVGTYDNWKKGTISANGDKTINAVNFINGIGYIGYNDGSIFKSTDGGNSWSKSTSGQAEGVNDIYFLNENIGFAACNYGIILKYDKSTDKWTKTELPSKEHINSIYFTNENTGYAAGNMSLFYTTNDGGATWNKYELGMFLQDFYRISGFNNNIYAIGSTGTILVKYANSDKFEFLSKTITSYNLRDICAYDNGKSVIAVGDNNTIVYKKNIDDDFAMKGLPNTSSSVRINTVEMISPDTAFLGTNEGKFYRTKDGGTTWTEISLENNRSVNDIKFRGNMGIFVGDKNLIYWSNNRGKNWNASAADVNKKINAVDFNDIFCVGVGDNGHIILSTTKGEMWQSITKNFTFPFNIENVNLTAVSVTDKYVYVGGSQGMFGIFNVAAQTYKVVNLGTTNDISSIQMAKDDSRGIVTTKNGEIYTTSDGNNWTKKYTSGGTELFASYFTVDMMGGKHIFVAGGLGNILHSAEAGNGSVNDNFLQLNSLKFYPNPTDEILYINKGDVVKTEVYDINYKLISTPETYSNTDKCYINVNQLSAGTYILKVYSLYNIEYIKFVKN